MVIRDNTGTFQLAQAIWYDDAASSLIMEARAVRDGIQLAVDRHFQEVDIETDAQEVIKMLDDPGGGRSEIACLCQEIKELGGVLASASFKYTGRLANEAAHLCAKRASSSRRRCLWVNYKPPFLEQVLWKDCNPMS